MFTVAMFIPVYGPTLFFFFNEEASTSAGVFTSTLNIGPEGVLTSVLDANHRMCYKRVNPTVKRICL